MGYTLYDVDGYVDVLGSAHALWVLLLGIEKIDKTGLLYDFVVTGKTRDPEGVIEDIVKILPQINDVNVKSSLETLQEKLQKCKEIALIEDE